MIATIRDRGRQLNDQLGTRGTVLVMLGLVFLARAAAVWTEDSWPLDAAVFYDRIPRGVRSIMWGMCGVTAGVCARRPRWHPVGFTAAIVMPIERATAHLWSFIMWVVPGAPGGDIAGLFWWIQWTCYATVIWRLGRWAEDRRVASGDDL